MKLQVGQQLIVGIKGLSLAEDEADFIVQRNIGGIILFARNCAAPEQLHALCAEIQALRLRMPDKVPLWIGIDNEGGRVTRLKKPFTQWPPMAAIGKLDSTAVAFKFATAMGAELRAVGINVNFAPSADVLTESNNPAIGDRAFGSDPELVARLASAVVRGFIKSGIVPCAKHFPGHGNATVDSHLALPRESRSLDDLRKLEITPFKKTMRARLDLIMTAHILFEKIDPVWPASLSSVFMRDILRDELRYRGLIVTDDLDMKALSQRWTPGDIAVQAVAAGANILLFCNQPDSPHLALEALDKALADKTLDAAIVTENAKRILDFKRAKLAHTEPLPFNQLSSVIGNSEHLELAKSIASGMLPSNLGNSAEA